MHLTKTLPFDAKPSYGEDDTGNHMPAFFEGFFPTTLHPGTSAGVPSRKGTRAPLISANLIFSVIAIGQQDHLGPTLYGRCEIYPCKKKDHSLGLERIQRFL